MSDLIVVRTSKNKNYKTIKLDCINDKNISWRAKGLHSYLISRPDGWEIWEKDLVNRSTEGRDAMRAARAELINSNYLYLIEKRDRNGRFCGIIHFTLETPEENKNKVWEMFTEGIENDENSYKIRSNSPLPENPSPVNPTPDKPMPVNHPLSKNKEYSKSKDSSKNKELKKVVNSSEFTNCDTDNCTEVFNKKTTSEIIKNKYVNYWNTKEYLRKHLPDKMSYQNAAKKFNLIEAGMFGKVYELSEQYMEINHITKEDLFRKVPAEEIFEAIDRFDRMHRPEYGDTKGYPKDCDKFLFNPGKGTSFFYSKLGKGKDPVPRHEKPIDVNVANLYQGSFFKKGLNGEEKSELYRGTNFIIRKRDDYFKLMKGAAISNKLNDFGLYKFHISFLREKYQDTGRLSVDTLKRKDIWGEFVRWLKHNHHINLEPSRDEINKAKEAYDQKVIQLHADEKAREMKNNEREARINRGPAREGIRARCQEG